MGNLGYWNLTVNRKGLWVCIYQATVALAHVCFCLDLRIRGVYLLLMVGERNFMCFFFRVQAARLRWNINGGDRGSKSSSWGKHLWFLVKKIAGYYLQSDIRINIRECLGKIDFKDFRLFTFRL